MDSLLQDLRYALRTLVKARGFSLVAILTLALGIGANTAIFSVVNRVLLEALPYRDADQVLRIYGGSIEGGITHGQLAPADFVDYQREQSTFRSMAVFGFGKYTKSIRYSNFGRTTWSRTRFETNGSGDTVLVGLNLLGCGVYTAKRLNRMSWSSARPRSMSRYS